MVADLEVTADDVVGAGRTFASRSAPTVGPASSARPDMGTGAFTGPLSLVSLLPRWSEPQTPSATAASLKEPGAEMASTTASIVSRRDSPWRSGPMPSNVTLPSVSPLGGGSDDRTRYRT